MRTTLRFAAAAGIMATAFSTMGASAYASQIPGGTSAPVTAVQQAGSHDPQGQVATQYRRHCRMWGYGNGYGHHRYRVCRRYY